MPARVKTLTRTTEIAIGSVSRSRDPDEPAGDAGERRGRQDGQGDDRERPEVAADDERAERLDRRGDRLGQRVQAVIRARRRRGEARPGRRRRNRQRRAARRSSGAARGRGSRWAQASASPTACSPCGKRATNRRLSAPRIANTTKNVSVLSIGSDRRPCWSTAELQVVSRPAGRRRPGGPCRSR